MSEEESRKPGGMPRGTSSVLWTGENSGMDGLRPATCPKCLAPLTDPRICSSCGQVLAEWKGHWRQAPAVPAAPPPAIPPAAPQPPSYGPQSTSAMGVRPAPAGSGLSGCQVVFFGLCGIAASFFSLAAGVYLFFLRASSDNSMLEAIANGMGLYFIGKAFFLGPAIWIAVSRAESHASKHG